MGPIGCPETSARNYHDSLRNNPEERESSSQLLLGGSLKSRSWPNLSYSEIRWSLGNTEDQWLTKVFWRPGRVISTAIPNRNYEIKRVTINYWISCYFSQHIKNCWTQKTCFFKLKYLFCCLPCYTLDLLFGAATLLAPPPPQATPCWGKPNKLQSNNLRSTRIQTDYTFFLGMKPQNT
jgi:hypothetical protein